MYCTISYVINLSPKSPFHFNGSAVSIATVLTWFFSPLYNEFRHILIEEMTLLYNGLVI